MSLSLFFRLILLSSLHPPLSLQDLSVSLYLASQSIHLDIYHHGESYRRHHRRCT